jgi:trehalose 6-phosphate phosphatase
VSSIDFGNAITSAGQAGLMTLLSQPRDALIGLDFDGTLSPIVSDPRTSRAHPGVVPVLKRLAGSIGTLAVITGRSPADAVAYGGLAEVPGIIVLGHYGGQRWQDGQLSANAALSHDSKAARLTGPALESAIERGRQALPSLLSDAGAPAGTWIEDKQGALGVHTRQTADPEAALDLLRGPLAALAAELGLAAEPGRFVIELRPGGVDKGAALTGLVREMSVSSDLYCGDDLGDLPAFAAVRTLRGAGIPGCAVASGSQETPAAVAAEADMVVDGPEGVVTFLAAIADALRQGG